MSVEDSYSQSPEGLEEDDEQPDEKHRRVLLCLHPAVKGAQYYWISTYRGNEGAAIPSLRWPWIPSAGRDQERYPQLTGTTSSSVRSEAIPPSVMPLDSDGHESPSGRYKLLFSSSDEILVLIHWYGTFLKDGKEKIMEVVKRALKSNRIQNDSANDEIALEVNSLPH